MIRLATVAWLAVLVIKYAAVIALGPAPLEMDALGYWQLSTLVINGDWLMLGEPIAYRTPLYPWFLAIVRWLAGELALPLVIGIQAGMLVASYWLAAGIARRVTGRAIAAPTTLLISLPAISGTVYAATVLTEALFVFLLMLHLSAVLKYREQRQRDGAGTQPHTVVLMAVTFAATLLTRPIVLGLWIPHLAFVCWNWRRDTRSTVSRTVTDALTAAAIVLVLTAPWMARNYRLFGEPFLTEFLGRNLWIVTFQDGSGAGLDLPASPVANELRQRIEPVPAAQWRETWPVSRALVASGLTDPQADRLMKRVALAAIEQDPLPFAYKAFRRTVNFWRCAVTDLPSLGSAAGDYRDQQFWSVELPTVRWLIEQRCSRHVWFNTFITAVIAAAVLVTVYTPSTRAAGIWLGLILVYFGVVTGFLEIPNYRYRMVVEPIAAAIVGSAVVLLLPSGRTAGMETGAASS